MERILIDRDIFPSFSIKAKIDYLAILTDKQIKVTSNSDTLVSYNQLAIVVNPKFRLEENFIGVWDKKKKIAFVEGNKFYIEELTEANLDKVVKLYKKNKRLIKEMQEEIQKREHEAFRKALGIKLSKAVDHKLKDLKELMELKKLELKLCQQTIIDTTKKLMQIRKSFDQTRDLKTAIKDDAGKIDKAIKEIMALKENGTYTEIDFRLNEIVAQTPMVYCEHKDDVYELGKYEVHVPLDNADIRIYNLTRQPGGYHHPHVKSDGQPCLGTLSEAIPKHIGRADFAVILMALNSYLHSYNPASPYHRVQSWPKRKDEE